MTPQETFHRILTRSQHRQRQIMNEPVPRIVAYVEEVRPEGRPWEFRPVGEIAVWFDRIIRSGSFEQAIPIIQERVPVLEKNCAKAFPFPYKNRLENQPTVTEDA